MRRLKVLFLSIVATLFFSANAMAYTYNISPESNLRSEIIELIGQPETDILNGQEIVANLRLMVNDENEIIVIDSGVNDKQLDRFLKSKLNYKKVKSNKVNKHNFYFVKVIFKN